MGRCCRRRGHWPAATFRSFAVNLGGLGFLTAITLDELYPELERAFRTVSIGSAAGACCTANLCATDTLVAQYEALNDVVLTKASLARMIEVETRVDRALRLHLQSRRSDRLHAHWLHCLFAFGRRTDRVPKVAALCITPICPHMLTNRPVLVPDDSVIQIISTRGERNAYLTIDGQVGEPLERDDRVVCRRSEKCVHLIRPPRMMFFDVLREKLKLGGAVKRMSLTAWIFIGMAVGIALGFAAPAFAAAACPRQQHLLAA